MADTTTSTKNRRFKNGAVTGGGDGDAEDKEGEECDVEAWDTLSKGFKQAQAVLDQNRELIRKVNENHQSKIPDNLVKNVTLIQEINGNISKVLEIYSNVSSNFLDIVRQRRGGAGTGNKTVDPRGLN